MHETLIQLAKDTAMRHGLTPEIVCGVCARESGWDSWLVRYEPGFEKRYGETVIAEAQKFVTSVKFTVTWATEIKQRCMSWGLAQIMGQVARERGFVGPLAQLCEPATGLAFACKHLAAYLKISGGDIRAALLRYNGGGDPEYPEKVMTLAAKYSVNPPDQQTVGVGLVEE